MNGGGLGFIKNAKALCAVYSDAKTAGPRETFTVAWLDAAHTRFTLKTQSGNYVSAINGGNTGGPNDSSSPVHSDASAIGDWETLTLNFFPSGRLTIATPDGHFLSAFGGGGIKGQTCPVISTLATEPGATETFTLAIVRQTDQKKAALPPLDSNPAVQQLDEDTAVRWIYIDDGMLFPASAPPAPILDPKTISQATVRTAALAFLIRYGAIWHMADPVHELRVSRYTAGEETAIVFDQWNGGVPVFDAGVLVTIDRAGRLTLVNSDYINGLDSLPKSAKKSAAEVREILLGDPSLCGVPSRVQCERFVSQPVLGVQTPERREPRLVYKASAGHYEFVIDPNTGEILDRVSTIQNAAPICGLHPEISKPQPKPQE